MDRNTWSPEYVGSFPNESDYIGEFNNSLYREPVEVDRVLYFPPLLANEIATYSPQTEVFDKVKYKDNNDGEETIRDFMGAVVYGDYVYFTPVEYPAIIQLNTKTMQITRHTEWVTPVRELTGDSQNGYFCRPTIVGSSMWLPIRNSNAVMEFYMDTGKHTIYEIGNTKYCFSHAFFDGTYFWWSPLYGTNTPVVKWSLETGVIKVS
jgi:hypothetical protein